MTRPPGRCNLRIEHAIIPLSLFERYTARFALHCVFALTLRSACHGTPCKAAAQNMAPSLRLNADAVTFFVCSDRQRAEP